MPSQFSYSTSLPVLGPMTPAGHVAKYWKDGDIEKLPLAVIDHRKLFYHSLATRTGMMYRLTDREGLFYELSGAGIEGVLSEKWEIEVIVAILTRAKGLTSYVSIFGKMAEDELDFLMCKIANGARARYKNDCPF